MSIQIWQDVETIKEQLTKVQASLSTIVTAADIAELIHEMKKITERVDRLERRNKN